MGEDAIGQLSPRQRDCLRLVLSSLTSKEIAIQLGLSPHTVEQHLKAARSKLGVSDSRAAARLLANFEAGQGHPQPLVTQPEPVAAALVRPFPWPWRTKERPRNDMSRAEKIAVSLALTAALATVAGVFIIAAVLLMRFLMDLSKHGG